MFFESNDIDVTFTWTVTVKDNLNVLWDISEWWEKLENKYILSWSIADGTNADYISTWTLSNWRFSAYNDLTWEVKLNNDDDNDILIRSQLDARYINVWESWSGLLDWSISQIELDTALSTKIDKIDVNESDISALSWTLSSISVPDTTAIDEFMININSAPNCGDKWIQSISSSWVVTCIPEIWCDWTTYFGCKLQ